MYRNPLPCPKVLLVLPRSDTCWVYSFLSRSWLSLRAVFLLCAGRFWKQNKCMYEHVEQWFTLITPSASGFPGKLSHCVMFSDAYGTHSDDTRLLEDSVLAAPQPDLSCRRVPAFQALQRWQEKRHMLEMQTRVIASMKGTAGGKYRKMSLLNVLSLSTFVHRWWKCDITALLLARRRMTLINNNQPVVFQRHHVINYFNLFLKGEGNVMSSKQRDGKLKQ